MRSEQRHCGGTGGPGAALGLACVLAWRVTGPVTAALVVLGSQLRQLADGTIPRSAPQRPGPRGSEHVALPKELEQLHADLVTASAGMATARERERLAEEARRELVRSGR